MRKTAHVPPPHSQKRVHEPHEFNINSKSTSAAPLYHVSNAEARIPTPPICRIRTQATALPATVIVQLLSIMRPFGLDTHVVHHTASTSTNHRHSTHTRNSTDYYIIKRAFQSRTALTLAYKYSCEVCAFKEHTSNMVCGQHFFQCVAVPDRPPHQRGQFADRKIPSPVRV